MNPTAAPTDRALTAVVPTAVVPTAVVPTTSEPPSGGGPPMRSARRDIPLLVSVVLAVLGLAAIAATIFGVRLVPILTGSMSPAIHAGSLVLTTPVDADEVTVGDVVAFQPPSPFQQPGNRPIMHRVESIEATDAGVVLHTKGDANALADPWTLQTTSTPFARAWIDVPHIGRFAAGGRLPLAAMVGGALLLMLVWSNNPSDLEVCTCPPEDDHAGPRHP